MKQGYDVVVAGAGNAAFYAALAARERVGRVLMLEEASRAWIGGNSYFTAGAFRTTFSDVEDLSPILGGLRIDKDGRVLDRAGHPMEGLYAAGGLFYHNYPGGSGLTSGTVFGRRAGAAAGDAGARTAGTSRAS
jgi:succinate dehydrogenase/fumarate reductase flavoprotein subunit